MFRLVQVKDLISISAESYTRDQMLGMVCTCIFSNPFRSTEFDLGGVGVLETMVGLRETKFKMFFPLHLFIFCSKKLSLFTS